MSDGLHGINLRRQDAASWLKPYAPGGSKGKQEQQEVRVHNVRRSLDRPPALPVVWKGMERRLHVPRADQGPCDLVG